MSWRPVVHIVDDDASLADALANLFASVDIEARIFGNAQEFLAHIGRDARGCVVLDVRLPGMSGMALHERMVEAGIMMPVIMVTGHGDIPMTVKAMKAGAIDFLPKPFREQELLEAVERGFERDRERQAEVASKSDLRNRFASLSQRERQVMLGVVAGQLNKQVAGDLDLSEVTVKIYRAKAMQKMGARTLADLVRMAEIVKSDG